MNLDNAQLAAFAMVIREGSFEAAARRLHVTPSAISQRIKQLEERLGQVLVQRATPCVPSVAGQALVRFAEEVALLETEMLAALGSSSGEEPPMVRIPVAVNADSLDSWFLDVPGTLPDGLQVVFDLHVDDQDHSAVLLREGSVMAAVSANPAAIQGCSVAPLGLMRYLAVASPGFLARHFADGVDAAALRRAPMLRFNAKDGLQHQFIAARTSEAVAPPIHLVPSVHGFVGLARRGLGWGMVPEAFARQAIAAGDLAEIVPGAYLDVPLYWHCWRLPSAALAALTAAVERAAAAGLWPMPKG